MFVVKLSLEFQTTKTLQAEDLTHLEMIIGADGKSHVSNGRLINPLLFDIKSAIFAL